ncbi:hypothetical protein [Ruegeria lacuscaerulensis]|uniref:hypothetical protein n=1 Tax=Ruegeria lacuscaerulensis TaxID=55218 RepID=UPI00148170CE|nr:hypothetical protein [Ruegeria lacuscaerulensis]
MASEYATSTNGATLTDTVTLLMGRREFDAFLHEMHGNPKNDHWKTPSKDLPKGEFDRSKFAQVEIFNDTLVGPITARHLVSSDAVQVEVKRPSEALWETAKDLIAEVRGGVAA